MDHCSAGFQPTFNPRHGPLLDLIPTKLQSSGWTIVRPDSNQPSILDVDHCSAGFQPGFILDMDHCPVGFQLTLSSIWIYCSAGSQLTLSSISTIVRPDSNQPSVLDVDFCSARFQPNFNPRHGPLFDWVPTDLYPRCGPSFGSEKAMLRKRYRTRLLRRHARVPARVCCEGIRLGTTRVLTRVLPGYLPGYDRKN